MNTQTANQTHMKLNKETLDAFRKHKSARRAMEDLWGVSYSTVQRWIGNNDPMLCNLSSLNIIGSYLKKEIDDMVVKEEIDFETNN
jgi:hypothetical protein